MAKKGFLWFVCCTHKNVHIISDRIRKIVNGIKVMQVNLYSLVRLLFSYFRTANVLFVHCEGFDGWKFCGSRFKDFRKKNYGIFLEENFPSKIFPVDPDLKFLEFYPQNLYRNFLLKIFWWKFSPQNFPGWKFSPQNFPRWKFFPQNFPRWKFSP